MYFISPACPASIHSGKDRSSGESAAGAMPVSSKPACWAARFTMDSTWRMELANRLPLRKERQLYAELLYFLVVILAVENVPLLRAFENGSLLGVDFCPGCEVDPGFLIEQLFENLSGFLADSVRVFDELHLVHLLENVRDGAGSTFTLSRLSLTAPPCICAPVRFSPCGTSPDSWRRCCASRRSR